MKKADLRITGIVAKWLLGFCVLGLGIASAEVGVGIGQCAAPPVIIASADPFYLTWTISDPSIAMFSPGAPGGFTVYVPVGSTSETRRDPLICGVNFGRTELGAGTVDTVTGTPIHQIFELEVTGVLSFSPSVMTVSISGREGRATLTLSGPAPRAVTISLSSNDPDISVPASVVIPAGSTSVDVPVIGVNTGAAIITTSANQAFIINGMLSVTIVP